MSEQEQFEVIKKSAHAQERILKRWAGNLTDGEGLIFVRTYKGRPGLIIGQITGNDLLVAMDHLLSDAASKRNIDFGEILARLAMLHYLNPDEVK